MEENTPMQGVDTAPQDQPESSVAAEGAANGELTDNAEAEGMQILQSVYWKRLLK